MDEQLQKAVVSHDVGFVEKPLNPSKARLQPPMIDYEALSDQFHEFKWPLPKVVDLRKAELTRLFLRAGNGSTNVDEGLHRAVYNFDADHVRLFLQEFNADPNCFDGSSHTPIYHLYSYDAYYERTLDDQLTIDNHDEAVKIMKMLIEKGAKMVTRGNFYNVLQVKNILEYGTTEAVSIILDIMDEIDLNTLYDNGNTVAHYLASNRNPNTLRLLHNRDFPVNLHDTFQWTPLVTAADRGVVEAVEFLLKKGADVNREEPLSNENPLCRAVLGSHRGEENYLECILLFLEHGVDVQTASCLVVDDDDNLMHRPLFCMLTYTSLFVNAAEIIMQHLALKKAIGTTITKFVQDTIDSSVILKEQLETYTKLLQNKIYGSRTLFSVLTCEEDKLVSLMRNEQLAKILQFHADHLKSINSIYYNRLLQKRLTKAGQIVELRGKAAFVVGKLMKMDYNCQLVVVDMVLRYLDLADLNTLLSLIL